MTQKTMWLGNEFDLGQVVEFLEENEWKLATIRAMDIHAQWVLEPHDHKDTAITSAGRFLREHNTHTGEDNT